MERQKEDESSERREQKNEFLFSPSFGDEEKKRQAKRQKINERVYDSKKKDSHPFHFHSLSLSPGDYGQCRKRRVG